MHRKIRIHVLGVFRLIDADGWDCTPAGRKSCALLALLALSAGQTRTRKWLQDKLWSDRGQPQGAASLRQSLVEIRRALGASRDIVRADRFNISLDPRRIEIDTDDFHPSAHDFRETGKIELLEGFDVRDPEFEEWLRDQRSRFEHLYVADASSDQSSIHVAPTPPNERLERLILKQAQQIGTPANSGLADCLLDAIAKNVIESGSLDVVDHRGDEIRAENTKPGHTLKGSLVLHAATIDSPNGNAVRVLLSRAKTNQVVWSAVAQADNGRGLDVSDEAFRRQVNQTVSVIMDEFVKGKSGAHTASAAAALCQEGANRLFQLGGDNFQFADQLFARAFDLEPKGIFLAWRAYARTFMLAERQFTCRKTLTDEAVAYIAQALELEPYNSHVASFAAQVHNIINRAYLAAAEFAQRSIELNPANPIGWSQLGAAKCHLGNVAGGFDDTRYAVRISGIAPYRFQLAGVSCIAGSMAGNVEHAVQAGETSHALAPTFAPALRYLTVLYLHQGIEHNSQMMVEKLQAIEPDFSYDSLKDPSYPSAGLNFSGLLDMLPRRQV